MVLYLHYLELKNCVTQFPLLTATDLSLKPRVQRIKLKLGLHMSSQVKLTLLSDL